MSKKDQLSSDSTLVTVEDLINRALGPDNTNQVDFKLLQAILQIFARQQRLLQQRVQLRISDRTKPKKKKKSQTRGGTSVEFDDDDDTELDMDQDVTPEKEEKGRGKKKGKRSKGTKKSEKELGKGSKVPSGLEISETIRDKEKVLVVERAPPTAPSTPRTPKDGAPSPRRRAIDVVTQRQFASVEASLEQLQRLTDYRQDDVADVTKQLWSRVQAAEAAVGRLVGVLAELADAGALPRDLRAALQHLRAQPERASEYRRGRRRSSSVTSMPPCVTRYDLDDLLADAMADMKRAVADATSRAAESAEWALRKAQAVGEKMERASSLSVRLSTLQALVEDHFQQIAGFETGLTTQIRQFQEQIEQIDGDLTAGLHQLKQVNTNTETAAVVALTERYEELVLQTEAAAADCTSIADHQARLAREIHNLAQALENLKEQKCDRAEVVDGLRDKATTSQLRGLLRVDYFETVRDELDDRLAAFHLKFHDQENRWMEALKELSDRVELKAQYVEVMRAREEAQAQLRAQDDRLRQLAAAIGEPQVALITRELLADTLCASCREPALPQARGRASSHRSHSDGESESPRKHACRRWCGGSHTLLSAGVTRERAPPPQLPADLRRYTGYGDDGRLYQLQAECQPCLECNKLSALQPRRGDGDQN